MDENMDNTDKLLCTLSYPIPIIGLILVLTKKEDRTCRYHGFNSLFLGIAFIIISTVVGMLGFIPGLGCLLASLTPVAFLVYAIFLAIETNNGKFPVIPVITDFAKKYIDPEG